MAKSLLYTLLAVGSGVAAAFIICCSNCTYTAIGAAHAFQIHRADSLDRLLIQRSQECDSLEQMLQKYRIQILRERYINSD